MIVNGSPRILSWIGPIQIVPSATHHLASAISTWTAVEHITLTNVSFPSDELGLHTSFSAAPLLPTLPRLRTLYIGQATFLPPSAAAAMVAQPSNSALESMRLVDTYRHSIWGHRIRRRDIENAAMLLADVVAGGEERRREVLERVRHIVRCEKKTERTQGGDNGDEEGVLE